jgi:PadR family transcriptional regulator AphA
LKIRERSLLMKRNKSLYAILGILSLTSQSGYEIKKKIDRGIGHFWNESYGQIYPILRQLVALEYATVQKEKQSRKPDKNVYYITEKGYKSLQKWLSLPVEPQVPRNELLLKLFFGRHSSLEDSVHHLVKQRDHMMKALQTYKEIEGYLTKELSGSPDYPYWVITLRQGVLTAEAKIKWCEESITLLEEREQ